MNPTFSRPTPYVYGCRYCDSIIKNGMTNSDPDSTTDQIISVVKGTDFNIIEPVLKTFFKLLESSPDKSKKIKPIVEKFVAAFQDNSMFRSIVIHFFNTFSDYPQNTIELLSIDTQFVLALFSCDSCYSKQAKAFLTNKILPKIITEKIPISDNLLFQLCDMDLPNFDSSRLDPLLQSNNSPSLAFYSHTAHPNYPGKLEQFQNPISLYSVILEYDSSLLTSQSHVEQLFDFYSDFNEKHAAIFILTLFSPKSRFKDYIRQLDLHQRHELYSMYHDIFVKRKINFPKLVDSLDIKEFPTISFDSCTYLFPCLCCFFDKQLISSSSFTRRWRNKDLQFSILSAMTKIYIPNLDFSKSGPQINMHQLDIPIDAFKQVNNCWPSLEFTERFISLMINNESALEQYLEPLINNYPALLIALLGQTKIRITEELINVIILPFINVLQGQQPILAVLWKLAEPFMNKMISELYERQPARIEIIFASSGKQLPALLMHENVALATDLAFYSAVQNKSSITQFISNYISKYTISMLPKIMDFIKSRMTEPLNQAAPLQTPVLNQLFAFLSQHFKSYPIEIRAFIKRTFITCETIRPELTHIAFDLEIPVSKLHEIKQTASMNYSMLLDGDITALDLLDMIEKYRATDPTLFSCHVHFLLAELKHLGQHATQDAKKLGALAGYLITSNILTSKQVDNIFAFIRNALSQQPASQAFVFSITTLENSLSRLSDYPQFVYDILHEPELRNNVPSLFDDIQKIGQAFNVPIQSSRTNVLRIHPKLRHYEQISSPPPSVCKAVQTIKSDPDALPGLLSTYPQYRDWIAYHIICEIQDSPEFLSPVLLQQLINSGPFLKYVFQASAAQAHQHILSPDFDKFEGGFLRRRLLILGRLIGQITLAINRPILGRFLDLKQVLLYAFSQGKLYGVVPFVCAIFSCASNYFAIPNPYTSSILQILAAVYSAENIKYFIKQNIHDLFIRFNTSFSRFALVPIIYPEKTQNNFDFVMAPFSLQHVVNAADLERIINFDETAFSQLVSQLIIIPDHPILQEKPELKEKMRRILMQQSLRIISSEGNTLSKVASSTAQTLAKKDFMLYSDNSILLEQAQTITRQLSAGLTLFTVPVKVSRQILASLRHESEGADIEWIESIVQINYDWIVQLLRDVVRLKAWKAVKQDVEKSDDERLQMQKASTTMSSYSLGLKQTFYFQMQQVYLDISEISLSIPPYPINESLQTHERAILPDPEFEEYLAKFQKMKSYQAVHNEEEIAALLQECPDLAGKNINFERFRSILKTLMKVAAKSINTPFEAVIPKIINNVCQNVPHSLIIKAQSYIATWMKTSLHSFVVISELLSVNLLTISQLDFILTEMLNSEPFNLRTATFVTQLFHFLLFRPNSTIEASSLISSLAVLTACRTDLTSYIHSDLESIHSDPMRKQYLEDSLEKLEELINVYTTMEVPMHQLSASSKLQMVSTFDPIEEMKGVDNIRDKFAQWSELIDKDNAKSLTNSDNAKTHLAIDEILKATSECASIGKDFFVYLFFNEAERQILQFLICLQKTEDLKTQWPQILDAIVMIIQGNANVVGFDMRKYYAIFRALMDTVFENPENNLLVPYLISLHNTRPLSVASFTFSWIELVTDKQLIYTMLSNNSNWSSYSILVTDYAAIVAQFDTMQSSSAFTQVYRSFLRFILILAHDFRDFLVSIQVLLLMALPFSFTQARNIILSVTPTTDIAPSLSSDDLLTSCPQTCQTIIKQLISIYSSPAENNNEGGIDESSLIKSLCNEIDSKNNNYILARAFIAAITQPLATLKQSDPIEDTVAYLLLCDVLEHLMPDMVLVIINLLVDRLRYDCRETNAFLRLILSLFKAKGNHAAISEVIARVIFERVSTPPPHPFGLVAIVKDLLNDTILYNLPLSMPNENVQSFLSAARTVFLSKK